jgi:hypothetical protein
MGETGSNSYNLQESVEVVVDRDQQQNSRAVFVESEISVNYNQKNDQATN